MTAVIQTAPGGQDDYEEHDESAPARIGVDGSVEVVKLLVAKDADISLADEDGWIPTREKP
ncbi:hypothetical protein FALCPG4_014432 [Fusarium falciforme]